MYNILPDFLFVVLYLAHFPQYATRSFSNMNTNPAPERTWSLSSKEVKALAHASGSDYVYALTQDEVSVNISPGTCSQRIHSKVQFSNTFLSHLLLQSYYLYHYLPLSLFCFLQFLRAHLFHPLPLSLCNPFTSHFSPTPCRPKGTPSPSGGVLQLH